MEQDLLFGAAYYLEYMPYDRLQEDIRMMKEAGMNVIRIAESTWSTLEPSDGVFDFSYIDRVLEIAEKSQMKVIIGTPTYAQPSWLTKKDPSICVMTKDGQAKYGHRQSMDIMNETYRFHAERVIRKLIEHTANVPCVIGFQIDNETKHYQTASKQVQQMFVQYLKEKFETTNRLNQAYGLAFWSNAIASFDDMPDMDGCINGSLASEFEKFQRTLAADFLQWQADLVNEYKREDQFITHNFDFEWRKFGADIAQDGYSYGVQPDMNHAEAVRAVTIAGTDIYHPTQDELTGAEIAFGGDEIRSLKQDNYFVLECQAQAFKYWTPYPGQLRLQAYSHLASGAASVMYWNWHSIHNGFETYWKGVLSHDLASNKTYEEAGKIGNEWKRIGKEHLIIRKKNKIAMLIDNHSLTSFKWFPIDRDLSYNDVVRWMYDSLYEMNAECDLIHTEDIISEKQNLSDYKMVVTPALYTTGEDLINKIREFVSKGGVLVSSFKSFVADRNIKVYYDAQPHHMTDCFGMSYNQFTEPGRTRVRGEAVKYFAELLKPDTAKSLADYEHPYWKEYAAVTENSFGEGTALYVGSFVSKDILKDIYEKAFERAKFDNKSSQWPIIVRSGKNAVGRKLHYVLHYGEEPVTWICPYEKVLDLLCDVMYQKGDVISLKDWEVCALEEI